MAQDSVFDEDEINQWIRRTEQIRDGLLGELPKLERVYTSAYAEASAHTEDGAPAPIFMPIIKALRSRVDHMRAQVTQAASNIDADNATLKKWMAEQKRNAENAKTAMDRVDTGNGLHGGAPAPAAPAPVATTYRPAVGYPVQFASPAARRAAEDAWEAAGSGDAWNGGQSATRASDGRWYDIDSRMEAAIEAGRRVDPDGAFTFTDTDGVKRTAATADQVKQWEAAQRK